MIKLKNILLEIKSNKFYYHVSPKKYKSGDIIQPYFNTEKYDDDSSLLIRKIVEDLLSKANTTNVTRDKSIFLFKDLSKAKQYAQDMKNRSIYKVYSSDLIKWFDMNWVDHLFGKLAAWGSINLNNYKTKIPKDNIKSLKRYAKYYWQGLSATELVSGYFNGAIWEGITNNPVKVIKKI